MELFKFKVGGTLESNHYDLKARVKPSKNSEPFRLFGRGTKPFAAAVALSHPIRLDTGGVAICAGLARG